MRKILFIASSALLLLNTGCNKYKGMTRGTIIDGGDISRNGCGYIILLEDNAYLQPVTMPSAFRHAGQKIYFEYNDLDKTVICNYDAANNKFIRQIEVTNIIKNLEK